MNSRLAILLSLGLAACGAPERTLVKGYCPMVQFVAATENHTDSKKGFGARLFFGDNDCKGFVGERRIVNNIILRGRVLAGDKPKASEVVLPIYLALERPDGSLAARFEQPIEIDIPRPGRLGDFEVKIEDLVFDVAGGLQSFQYRFLVGFRLNKAQLAANRKLRKKELGIFLE